MCVREERYKAHDIIWVWRSVDNFMVVAPFYLCNLDKGSVA